MQTDALVCVTCGGSRPPLFPIHGTDDVIHPICAKRSSDYGLCRYCDWSSREVAWYIEDLTSEGECPDHAGESAPDGPDLDDLIENLQKNDF